MGFPPPLLQMNPSTLAIESTATLPYEVNLPQTGGYGYHLVFAGETHAYICTQESSSPTTEPGIFTELSLPHMKPTRRAFMKPVQAGGSVPSCSSAMVSEADGAVYFQVPKSLFGKVVVVVDATKQAGGQRIHCLCVYVAAATSLGDPAAPRPGLIRVHRRLPPALPGLGARRVRPKHAIPLCLVLSIHIWRVPVLLPLPRRPDYGWRAALLLPGQPDQGPACPTDRHAVVHL